jgi:hypothetical protein
MKDIVELTEVSNEDLPEIYCDLDEVLVNPHWIPLLILQYLSSIISL